MRDVRWRSFGPNRPISAEAMRDHAGRAGSMSWEYGCGWAIAGEDSTGQPKATLFNFTTRDNCMPGQDLCMGVFEANEAGSD